MLKRWMCGLVGALVIALSALAHEAEEHDEKATPKPDWQSRTEACCRRTPTASR